MHLRRTLLGLAALVAALVPTLPAAAAPNDTRNPSLASFEGRTIDLRKGWGDAQACTTDGTSTTCYRTEDEMDAALGTIPDAESGSFSLLSACSSSLRLYASNGFALPVLNLSAQGSWLNLSTWGFDDRTSSYIVGACNSSFTESAFGGGAGYPGPTWAFASASSMAAGWNDRISSVFIF